MSLTPHSGAEVRASRASGPLECEVGQSSATIHVDRVIRMALRSLLNHAVGPEKQRLGECHPQCLRGPEVYHQLEARRSFDG